MPAMSDKATNAAGDRADQPLVIEAPAKINLNLLVGPRRSDGYHDLDSYVCKVSLCDRIELRPLGQGPSRITCDGFDCGQAQQNLALRAAQAFGQKFPQAPAVDIRLLKRIAPGSGLGGGSSDAAAVLMGMNRLAGRCATDDELRELGASLGSDVPLFLLPGPCRMAGRGERVGSIRLHSFDVVLVLPGLHCSTAQVYRQFDAACPGPMASQLDAGLLAQQPASAWSRLLVNDLQAPAMAVCPELDKLKRSLELRVPLGVHMSGSGSSLFVLCDTAADAQKVLDAAGPELRPLCHHVTVVE